MTSKAGIVPDGAIRKRSAGTPPKSQNACLAHTVSTIVRKIFGLGCAVSEPVLQLIPLQHSDGPQLKK